VAGDQRPLQLGQDGVLEAQDAWPDRPTLCTLGEACQQIFPEFFFDAPFTVSGGTQFADGAGQIVRSGHHTTLLTNGKAGQSSQLPGLPR